MRKIVSLLLSGLFVWLVNGCVVARYTVIPDFSGIVVDAETGKPLGGVAVSVRSEQSIRTEMITREDGTFSVRAKQKVVCEIPLGDRFISGSFSFTKEGYDTAVVGFGGVHSPGPLPAKPAEIKLKRAEPGATDNPDSAQ